MKHWPPVHASEYKCQIIAECIPFVLAYSNPLPPKLQYLVSRRLLLSPFTIAVLNFTSSLRLYLLRRAHTTALQTNAWFCFKSFTSFLQIKFMLTYKIVGFTMAPSSVCAITPRSQLPPPPPQTLFPPQSSRAFENPSSCPGCLWIIVLLISIKNNISQDFSPAYGLGRTGPVNVSWSSAGPTFPNNREARNAAPLPHHSLGTHSCFLWDMDHGGNFPLPYLSFIIKDW